MTGVLNACLITEIEDVSPATSVHSVYSSSFGLSSATSCTLSVYCKPAGVNRVQLLSTVGGSVRNAIFNIGNGTVISESSATGAVESVGNGFYRISITYTAPATTNGRVYLNLINDSGTSDYAGNGYNGVITSGFQFEQNSFASSLITSDSGSQTTRAADSASAVASGIGYTGGPMTLVTDTTVSDPTSTQFRAAAYVYVDSSNAAGIWATSTDSRIARVETGGIGGNVGTNSGVNGKAALSIDTNDIAACLNGGTVATDTSHAMADFGSATLYVGNFGTYANQLNGHIKRLALYNEALSDTNLQALTS